MNTATTASPSSAPVSVYSASFMREVIFPILALVACAFLKFQWVLYAFIIVGHAHFLMAYLYQYRGKKINLSYIVTALTLLLASVVYFGMGFGITPILIFSGILFSVHFAIDEFTLHGETLSWFRIATVAGFGLLFSALVLTIAFPALSYIGPLVGVILAVGTVFRFFSKTHPPSVAEKYLWVVEIALFILAVGFHAPDKVLGIILLLHFANWYVGFGDRLKSDPVKARKYWSEVIVTLLIPAVLFAVFMLLHPGITLLSLLFLPQFYYAWAVAHIILSFVSAKWRFQA